MRSSTTLFQAVLLALATASPRPEIPHIGTAAVSHAEPRSLVARADDLSPELAQLVADNGITSTCYSSTEPPIVLTAKKAKRQEDLVPRQEGLVAEACSYPNPDICKPGFTPLCCDAFNPSQYTPVGLIESGCVLITYGATCPPENTECCLNWIRNPLAKINPAEFKGWGMYCYNPQDLFGVP